ncbi:MAG: glycosyltransferase family 4 protein [Bacteroidota bacterium]
MEILFISHKYPPTIGGMEKQCYELIAHAEKENIVHKIVFTGEEESKLTFFRKLKFRVKNTLRRNPNIEVIHLNDGLMGLFTLWLKQYTSIPVIITFHGLDLVFPNRFYQRFISKKYTQYDAAICVSTATAEACLQRGFPKEKVFVVPNGVDHQIADFQPNRKAFLKYCYENFGCDLTNRKVIVTLGRAVQRKGFSWFLENVIPQLDDEIITIMVGPVKPPQKSPWWHALVPNSILKQIQLAQGGLSDEDKIRDLLKNKRLKNKVIQTGKLPFQQLLEMLSLADLFVMPNVKKAGDAEGFGLVALEASIRKATVLASNLEGIPEAIKDQKNGYLLPSANAEIWIEKIHWLLNSPKELQVQATQFQKYTLENYSWEKMTRGYLKVFQAIINKKKERR